MSEHLQVPINGIHGANRFAKVDPEDYNLISRYSWHLQNGYAVTKSRGKNYRMHRLVLDQTDPLIIVDHINRDRLDNRRSNLRLYTPIQNANNRTTSRKVYAFEEWKTIGEWARDERCSCPYNILRKRLEKEIWPEVAILAAWRAKNE
jgi:hypothetical protein